VLADYTNRAKEIMLLLAFMVNKIFYYGGFGGLRGGQADEQQRWRTELFRPGGRGPAGTGATK
jgi:hypothetical protein